MSSVVSCAPPISHEQGMRYMQMAECVFERAREAGCTQLSGGAFGIESQNGASLLLTIIGDLEPDATPLFMGHAHTQASRLICHPDKQASQQVYQRARPCGAAVRMRDGKIFSLAANNGACDGILAIAIAYRMGDVSSDAIAEALIAAATGEDPASAELPAWERLIS